MAWYEAGAGAGVWDNAIINPSLKNILHQLCTAVNEREIYRGSSLTVSSITRSGTTATLTAAANHGLATGAKVYVFGADQSEYNGLVTITVTGATTFTYTVSGSPATPATGTIKYRKPSSLFTYNENGDQKMFPAVADFVGLPLSRIGTGPARTLAYSFTPTSITRLFTVATINTTAEIIAKVTVGDSIEITGADQAEYNGVWAVISKGATSFTVDIGTTPATPATGTITVRHYARMTRSGSTVTVWLRASGLKVGDRVEIAGAAESDYNGWQTVTAIPSIVVTSITRSGGTATVNTSAAHGLGVGDVVAIEGCAQAEYNKFATIASVPTATSFTYSVSGSPATPATGTPNCNDLTRFQFTTSATPSSPATGSITATAHRHLVAYAEYSGGTTTFQCYEHGLTTGNYLEVVSSNSGSADMHEYGAVTVTNSNTFTMSTASFGGSPHIAGISDFMWAVPEGKFRRLLRELQTAIAGLLTASTDAGTIRYVEDSSPYETNYTLSALLSAGSYGSSWVSLKGLSRGDLANVVMQMQDALDLLDTMTVVITNDMDTNENVVKWDSNAVQETSWDNAVAASVSLKGNQAFADCDSPIALRMNWRDASVYKTFLTSSRTLEYTFVKLAGNFVDGFLRFWQSHDYRQVGFTSVSQSSYTVTDGDGDTFSANASLGTTESEIKVTKPESFFTTSPRSLSFSIPEPASHPFPALAVNEATARFVEQPPTSGTYPSGQYTHRLAPGTHLTYG